MSRGSATLTTERRNEIIDACERLYQTLNFKDNNYHRNRKGNVVYSYVDL